MYKQGDIWLVDFDPSVGHEYQKVRPALILENTGYISVGNLLTVVPISSQIQKSTLLDVLIPRNTTNRLLHDSIIKTRQISSFDKRRFIKRIGFCQPDVLLTVLSNTSLFLKADQ
ncbi:type II toxin-antitoxin system PemK/MazF family toxin [Spirosoma rhododendri]|uniref:mRNA interferase n=1 Tax=Spirosoma rhododendri TaxID=2728024 RepID=A0A7L5DWF0_9BACT|nr:type II toxin-antitoxin system PemK/MazF family toxin [Spirosoma rhododendri]